MKEKSDFAFRLKLEFWLVPFRHYCDKFAKDGHCDSVTLKRYLNIRAFANSSNSII